MKDAIKQGRHRTGAGVCGDPVFRCDPWPVFLFQAPDALHTDAQFRARCPKGHETRPHIRAFAEWISRETCGTDAPREGRQLIHVNDAAP